MGKLKLYAFDGNTMIRVDNSRLSKVKEVVVRNNENILSRILDGDVPIHILLEKEEWDGLLTVPKNITIINNSLYSKYVYDKAIPLFASGASNPLIVIKPSLL